MQVRFPEVDENYIKSKVEAGYYTNETEVVRDAIRRMREAEKYYEKLEALQAAVEIGHQQMLRGEMIPYTPDFMEKSMQRAKENLAMGKAICDDVKPA